MEDQSEEGIDLKDGIIHTEKELKLTEELKMSNFKTQFTSTEFLTDCSVTYCLMSDTAAGV